MKKGKKLGSLDWRGSDGCYVLTNNKAQSEWNERGHQTYEHDLLIGTQFGRKEDCGRVDDGGQ